MKTPRNSMDDSLKRDDRSARSAHEQAVIPVMKEELDVRKQRVETGSGARVVKTVEEREEIVDEPLTREEVTVERVAVNRAVDGPVAVRYEGETMIVPVLEEVLFVEKRLMLKEEIRITRRKAEFSEPQRVVLRSERAAVERIEDAGLQGTPAVQERSPREGESAESLLEKKRQQDEELRSHVSSQPPAK